MWITVLIFIGLLVLGVPVGFVIAATAMFLFVLSGNEMMIFPQKIVSGVNSFPLMAIPLFILAGELMNFGGITTRIFDFARTIVGHIRGGLGHANIVASTVFAGMSGAAVSDAAGLGTIEMKAMREQNYPDEFSIGVTVASSTIGPIMPPSINFIIYGSLASVSTGALFLAGVIPGVVMALSMMVLVYIFARRRDYPRDKKSSLKQIWQAFIKAFFPLLTPGIILGCILFGIATPTEASVMAVVYALFLGGVVYRLLTWRILYDIFVRTSVLTATIMIIIGVASPLGFMLSKMQIPQMMLEWLLSFTTSTFVLWVLLLLLLLFLGLFMEATTVIIVLVPILLPILITFDINLIHFGVVLSLALSIGLCTPPVGILLFVGSQIADMSVERVIRGVTPFLIPLVIVLILITLIPEITLFLPDMFTVEGGG